MQHSMKNIETYDRNPKISSTNSENIEIRNYTTNPTPKNYTTEKLGRRSSYQSEHRQRSHSHKI